MVATWECSVPLASSRRGVNAGDRTTLFVTPGQHVAWSHVRTLLVAPACLSGLGVTLRAKRFRRKVHFPDAEQDQLLAKLAVTHDGFHRVAPSSPRSRRLPAVLSSLKTLVETGSTLSTAIAN